MARFQGDLPARSYRFGLQTLSLVDQLPQGVKGWAFAKQLVRCGTSIGANVQEADNALTDKEFASACNIARRESAETNYHLRLAKDHGLLSGPVVDAAIDESEQLLRILATIVRKTQSHINTE